MSTSRLSEIERGGGSFTAEQLLLILKLFNVPASYFAEPKQHVGSLHLQNALARLGAHHLYESPLHTPSELLYQAHNAIRGALLEGSPRTITALAPVFVRNIQHLSPARLHADVGEVGHQGRLGWTIENTIVALDEVLRNKPRNVELQEARLRLQFFLKQLREQWEARAQIEDILDGTIRSEKTLEQVKRTASPISNKWHIVTIIQPDDFVKALKASLAAY
jgi:transcriptional regulator with XRE-family HTH domain